MDGNRRVVLIGWILSVQLPHLAADWTNKQGRAASQTGGHALPVAIHSYYLLPSPIGRFAGSERE